MNSGLQNIKKYEKELRMLLEELGLDQIEFEFNDFSHDKHLEIDLEFDDDAIEQV
jgi:hypothetical protein